MRASLRMKRALVGTAVGAMVLGLMPASAAFAEIDYSDVCANAEADAFPDGGATHGDALDCMAAYGVYTGLADGTAGTFNPITREQMASLLVRFALTANEAGVLAALDLDNAADFSDVSDTNVHADNIAIISALGITANTDTFNPKGLVTRGQMASFLVSAHELLGVTFPADPTTAFVDVPGTTHAANIAKLESVDLIAGVTATMYEPNANVGRGATATLLARSAQVLQDNGLWDALLPAPSNQTFMVTPGDATTLSFVANADTNTSDDRVYTVSNAVVGALHQVVLVKANQVSIDAGGVVTFADVGNNALADLTLATSDITVINGVPSDGDATTSITPTSTSFTFRVDGDADETVVPVVYFDADTDGSLDLNADDTPVAAEAFGVGGAINYNPAEATTGVLGADATVTEVDKDADVIIAGGTLYEYDSNDTFCINSTAFFANELDTCSFDEVVTMADFEAQLSVDDQISWGTEYGASEALSSTFILEDIAPTPLTGLAVTTKDTSAVVTVNTASVASGATVNVKVVADGAAFTATAVATASATADADTTTAQFQVNVSGLTPSTNYEVFVYQTVGGEDSDTDTAALNTGATAETVPPTITDLVLTVDGGTAALVGSGDTVTFQFSEAMAAATATGFFRLADGDTTRQFDCTTATVTCTLVDGSDADAVATDAMTVVLTGDGTLISGTDNGLDTAGGTVTLTFVSSAWDDAAGNQLNLAGSSDVVVDDES